MYVPVLWNPVKYQRHYYSIPCLLGPQGDSESLPQLWKCVRWRLRSQFYVIWKCEQSEIKAVKDLPKLIAGIQCARQAALQTWYHLLKASIAPSTMHKTWPVFWILARLQWRDQSDFHRWENDSGRSESFQPKISKASSNWLKLYRILGHRCRSPETGQPKNFGSGFISLQECVDFTLRLVVEQKQHMRTSYMCICTSVHIQRRGESYFWTLSQKIEEDLSPKPQQSHWFRLVTCTFLNKSLAEGINRIWG